MRRPDPSRPILAFAITAAAAATLSGCFAAPAPTSSPDAAAAAPAAERTPLDCIQRARLVDTEDVRTYHERLLRSLRTTPEPQYAHTFNGRYAIGFEEETFWVEPALDIWVSDGATVVDVRQTGRLSGRYSIDEDGVISTTDVVDGRVSDQPVDPAAGAAAAMVRQLLDDDPIEGATARCDGDVLVLALEVRRDDGHRFEIRLP